MLSTLSATNLSRLRDCSSWLDNDWTKAVISDGFVGIETTLLARLCLKGEPGADLRGLLVGDPAMAKLFVDMAWFWAEKKAIFDLTSAAIPISDPLLESVSKGLGDCGICIVFILDCDIGCNGVPGVPGGITSCCFVLSISPVYATVVSM